MACNRYSVYCALSGGNCITSFTDCEGNPQTVNMGGLETQYFCATTVPSGSNITVNNVGECLCVSLTEQILAPYPQTGLNNFFGIKLSIDTLVTQDITITGYLDNQEGGTYPYTLTISGGTYSVETANNVLMGSSTAVAINVITNVTPTTGLTTTTGTTYICEYGIPLACEDCLCKQIVSERGDDVTYSYYDCYNNLQTSGFLPAMGTVYQCVCSTNPTITFDGGQTDIFVYANGGCADYQNCDSQVTPTPTTTVTSTPTVTATNTPTVTATSTPAVTATSTPTLTSTSTPTLSATSTPTLTSTAGQTSTPTPTNTTTPTVTSTSTPTLTSTSTPTLTSTSGSGCVNDTVTPKGVLINFNSGSDYTNCSVYTGTSSTVITGATSFTTITGGTVNITGITPTLMEIYVKIVCIGCCEQVFRVNLDECCGYVPSGTSTPTPTSTLTSTPTPTKPTSPCDCNTYRVTFTQNCGEAVTWTDCDSNTTMSEQGLYFGLSGSTFYSGAVIILCSCSVPTIGCPSDYYDILLMTSGCTTGTTSTPTPTVTSTSTPTLTATSTTTPNPTRTATPTPTCSYKAWTVGVCSSSCNGSGICTCVGTTATTVYTNCNVTDILDGNTQIYETSSLTSPFNGFFTYQPGTNPYVYYSTGLNVSIECPLGNGC